MGDGPDHDRGGDARSDRRLRRVDEDEAPDAGRGQRVGRHDAAATRAGCPPMSSAPTPSTSSAPAVTAPTPSTSPRWPRSWWPPPGCRWSSTATARRRRWSGGADMLEALGVRIDLGPDEVARCVAEVGIGFCFAPVFHPSYKYAGAAAPRDRRADGIQSAWAADQSGRPAGRSDRLRVRRPGRGDGRGVRGAPLQRARGARRRRSRRADHHDDQHHLAGAGRHHRQAHVRPAGIRVSPAPGSSELVGGDAEVNAAEARRCSPAPRARCATRWSSTRPGRWSPTPGYPVRRMAAVPGRTGCHALPRRSTAVRRGELLDRWARFTQSL